MIKRLFFVIFATLVPFLFASSGLASSSEEIYVDVKDDELHGFLYAVPFAKNSLWLYFKNKTLEGRPKHIAASKARLLDDLYQTSNFREVVKSLTEPKNQDQDNLDSIKSDLNKALGEFNSPFKCVGIFVGKRQHNLHELDPHERSAFIQALNCCSMDHGLYFCPPDFDAERTKYERLRLPPQKGEECDYQRAFAQEVCVGCVIPCATDMNSCIGCSGCLITSARTGSVALGMATYCSLCLLCCLFLDVVRDGPLLRRSFKEKEACAAQVSSCCPVCCHEVATTVIHYIFDQRYRTRVYDLLLCCKPYARGAALHHVEAVIKP